MGVKAQGEGLIIQLCGSVNAKKIVSRSKSKGRSKRQKQKQKEKQKQKQKAKANAEAKAKSKKQKQKQKQKQKAKAEAKAVGEKNAKQITGKKINLKNISGKIGVPNKNITKEAICYIL